MQSVLAAFVEELSNERIELKCVNDLALETLLRLKLLMRCLHINHEQLVPGRCFVPYRIALKHKPQLAPGIELAMGLNMTVVCFALLCIFGCQSGPPQVRGHDRNVCVRKRGNSVNRSRCSLHGPFYGITRGCEREGIRVRQQARVE